jgi:hypothetical protein
MVGSKSCQTEYVQEQQHALHEFLSPSWRRFRRGLATGSASQNKPKRLRGQNVGNGEPSNRATKRNERTVEMKPPGDDYNNLPDATMEDVVENYVDQEQLRMKLSNYAAGIISETKPYLHKTLAKKRKGWAINGKATVGTETRSVRSNLSRRNSTQLHSPSRHLLSHSKQRNGSLGWLSVSRKRC